jgi:hypothetical protein
MKHTTFIRPITSLLILGGLLLPALIGCEVGEIPEDTTTTVASTTDAPENSAPTTKHYDSLALLLEEQTVQQIGYYDFEYAPTIVYTKDAEQIQALLSLMDTIPAEGFTNRCTCGAVDIPDHYYYFTLHTQGNGKFSFTFDMEEKCLYYEYNNSTTNERRHSHLKVSEEHWTQLFSFAGDRYKTLFPQMEAPSPDSYLDEYAGEVILRYRHESSGNNVTMSTSQTAAIVAKFKETLTDLPLCGYVDGNYRFYYSIEMNYAGYDEVYLALYPDPGIVEVDVTRGDHRNSYCFQIPSVNAYELATWLKGYYDGQETSTLPKLEDYLKLSAYRIEFYETPDTVSPFRINDASAKTAFYQLINKLQFTLLSEEIPAESNDPDGMKIVVVTTHNTDQLILEFDSEGWINCSYIAAENDSLRYAARYALSPEDMAALTGYFDKEIADATAVPTLDEYFAGDVFATFYYSSAEPDIYASLRGKDKITPIQSYLQTMHFTRSETAQTVNRDNGFSLNVTRSDRSVILRFDLQTGYLSAVWDGLPEEILPAQYYQFSPAEVEGLLDLFDPYLEEWEEPIPENVPDTTE